MAAPKNEVDLSAVPLFPLPNVVLFPRAVLPLHIFEERYKAMMADALRGDGQIAMALLKSGWEKNYHGKTGIEPVVCVGKILTHERLPDGRYNFLLQGHTRARLVREIETDHTYRVAELEPLVERSAMEIDLDEARRRILGAFECGSLTSTGIGQKFQELLQTSIPTAQIADLIAFHFLENIPLKQSLLAERDVRKRVGRLAESFELLYSAVQCAAPVDFGRDPSLN
jgi:Lon protease-like protein